MNIMAEIKHTEQHFVCMFDQITHFCFPEKLSFMQ